MDVLSPSFSRRRAGRAALLAAVALYAAAGSPTPDRTGWVEAGILVLLALACVCAGWPRAVLQSRPPRVLAAFVLYGVCAGTLAGVLAGNTSADMLRDVLGFAVLAVPLALAGLFPAGDARAQTTLRLVLLAVGYGFAVRYLLAGDMLVYLTGTEPLYLANSPLVALAAAGLLFYGSFREPRLWRAVFYIAASCVPVLAMAGMMQRATLALLALAWGILWGVTARDKPRRALALAAGLAAVLFVCGPWLAGLATALLDKTNTVGWNARGRELAALADTLAQDPLTALFGTGWGSVFRSPAVGGGWVRFSHSLFTSLWWKLGWLGVSFAVVSLGGFLLAGLRRLRTDVVGLAAMTLATLPALFLYGSYKSLCFGLLLLGWARLDWTSAPKDGNQTPDGPSNA